MTKLETIIYAKNLILATKSQNEDTFDVIIESLDKQMPKKPTEYDSVPHARCPHCTKGVRVYCDSAKVPFCQWCGQALDWGDNDD